MSDARIAGKSYGTEGPPDVPVRPAVPQGAACLAAAFAAGILIARLGKVQAPAAGWFLAAALAASLVALLQERMFLTTVAALCAVAALGIYGGALHSRAIFQASQTLPSAGSIHEGVILRFRAVVFERLSDGRHSDRPSRYRMRLLSVETNDGPRKMRARAVLQTPLHELPFAGVIEGTALFRRQAPPANPGEFDYRRYLAERGIALSAAAPSEELVRVVDRGRTHAFSRAAYASREWLSERLSRLDLDSAGVIPAVVLGDRSALSPETKKDFIRSGTMHLLAISGLHLGIVAGLLWWLMRAAGVSISKASVVTVLAAAFYAVVVGARPPVVRAALMLVLFSISVITWRRPFALSVVSVTAMVMLAANPGNLFDPGFQLSLVAVLGIFYIGVPLGSRLSERVKRSGVPLRRAIAGLAHVFGFSFGVWISVALLGLYHFGVVSFISPLSNIVLIPVTWAMTVAGFAAALLSVISLPIARFFALSASGAEATLCRAAGVLSRVPCGYSYLPPPPLWVVIAGYILLVLVARRASRSGRVAGIVLASLAVLNAAVFGSFLSGGAKAPEITMLVHRSSRPVVVIDDNRAAVLFVDSRANLFTAENIISPFLLERGVTRIDLLVETASADARIRDELAARFQIGCVVRQRRFLGSPLPAELYLGSPDGTLERPYEIGPGDVVAVRDGLDVKFHCGLPEEFGNPSNLYFPGLICDVRMGDKQAAVFLDVTDACASVAGWQSSVFQDVLILATPGPLGPIALEWATRLGPLPVVVPRSEGETPTAAIVEFVPVAEIKHFKPDG